LLNNIGEEYVTAVKIQFISKSLPEFHFFAILTPRFPLFKEYMSSAKEAPSARRLSVISSVTADVWHGNQAPDAYEWWYFDAISDDGSEAIAIWFLDNAVSSPRYNRTLNIGIDSDTASPNERRFPGVFFAYYKNGKPIVRTFNEFSPMDFSADQASPACKIGPSGFRFDAAPYGSGYSLEIRSSLSRGQMLEAKFEWVSIEADFLREDGQDARGLHVWNIVAPRSDVSGRIDLIDRKGKVKAGYHFRGTGYHDHEYDSRRFADTILERHWGRAHFTDSTVVFQKHIESEGGESSRLVLIKDGRLIEREVRCEEQNFVRNKFGIKYPTRVSLTSDDGIRLRIKPIKVLDSSFYNLRFASEMTLTLRDGKPRKSIGLTEIVAPKTLKYRWLDWLADMRILRVR